MGKRSRKRMTGTCEGHRVLKSMLRKDKEKRKKKEEEMRKISRLYCALLGV